MSLHLPEVEALLSLPRETWRSLGHRLKAVGYDPEAARPFQEMTAGLDPRRSPLVKWHLRRLGTAAGDAMRLFGYGDAVAPPTAQTVLGAELPLPRMLDAGLLRHDPEGGIVCPFVVRPFGSLHVVCDDLFAGGDAVMGPSVGTRTLIEIAYPGARVARALDLGCGAGTVALALSSSCDRVVATDVNPRAVAVATVNTWLNGVHNVEVRRGDLFAPIAADAFDLVVSQPPFVARPPQSPPAAFLFGGERGDELPLRVLREAPRHLAPGGMALIMVEWPVIDGEPPFPERVREAVGASADLLVLEKPQGDVDLHCVFYGKIGHDGSDASAEHEALRRRDHLEQHGIRAIRTGYTIVRQRPGVKEGWTATLPWQVAFEDAEPTREHVDRLVASNDLAGSPAARGGGVERPTGAMPTALVIAERQALEGGAQDALDGFARILALDASCAPAMLGTARIEIARGDVEAAATRLASLVQLGDREARRLLGDIQWSRGDLAGAFASYAVDPRPATTPRPAPTACRVENRVGVVRRTPEKRPFLVWVTCPTFGESVASRWFRAERSRRWDLAVNAFAPPPQDHGAEHAEHVVLGGPSKLAAVRAALAADPSFFDGYRAMLFLDDDVGMRHDDVDRLFWLMARYQLDLAHPSLSEDSSCALPSMFHQRESAVRFASVVDVRAPGFSRAGFLTCVESFDQSISARGLGHVWSHLLAHRGRVVGVLDEVTARHLRPADSTGGFHRHVRGLGVDPAVELHQVLRHYACAMSHARTVGDVDHHGRERHFET